MTRGVLFFLIYSATVMRLNFWTSAASAAFLPTASAALHSQWLIPPSEPACSTLTKHDKDVGHGRLQSCAVYLVKDKKKPSLFSNSCFHAPEAAFVRWIKRDISAAVRANVTLLLEGMHSEVQRFASYLRSWTCNFHTWRIAFCRREKFVLRASILPSIVT